MGPRLWQESKGGIAPRISNGGENAWKVENGANIPMRKKKKAENKILWEIIHDLIWMAARYAHGRHTYAPSIIRDSVKKLKVMDQKFKMRKDVTIEAPEHELKGFDFRNDYLDDLYEEDVK